MRKAGHQGLQCRQSRWSCSRKLVFLQEPGKGHQCRCHSLYSRQLLHHSLGLFRWLPLWKSCIVYMFSTIEQFALSGLMGISVFPGQDGNSLVSHGGPFIVDFQGKGCTLEKSDGPSCVLNTALCLTLLPFSIIILYLAVSLFETAHF